MVVIYVVPSDFEGRFTNKISSFALDRAGSEKRIGVHGRWCCLIVDLFFIYFCLFVMFLHLFVVVLLLGDLTIR